MRTVRAIALALVPLLAGPAGAQTAAPPVLAAPAPQASPLARVAFVGASVSAGFFATFDGDDRVVTLERAFRAVLAEPGATATESHASAMFFMDPGGMGERFLSGAIAGNPTMIVAVDYLFWYGYGATGLDRRPLFSASDRLGLLEKGLAQLERFDGPLVVGDFPDMSDAVGAMLSESQVPDAAALEKLNARLREWAAERPNVIVVPLSDVVAQIKAGKGVKIGPRAWPAEEAAGFITEDKLHPSPAGQVVIATAVADAVDARFEAVTPEQFAPGAALERLRNEGRPEQAP